MKALVWAVMVLLLLAVNAGAKEEVVDMGNGFHITIQTSTQTAQFQGGGSDHGTNESIIKSAPPISGIVQPHYSPVPIGTPEKKVVFLRHYQYVEEELFQNLQEIEDFFEAFGIILQSPLVAKNIGKAGAGGDAYEVKDNSKLPTEAQLLPFSVVIPGNYEAIIPSLVSLGKLLTGNNQLYFSKQLISASYNHGRNMGFGGGSNTVGVDAGGMGSIGYNSGDGKALALPEYVLSCYVFMPNAKPEKISDQNPLIVLPITGNLTEEFIGRTVDAVFHKWDRETRLVAVFESDRYDSSGWETLAKKVLKALRDNLIVRGIPNEVLLNRLSYEIYVMPKDQNNWFGADDAVGRMTIIKK